MGTEGILRVKLTGDNSGFSSSMKEASKETGNFGNSAKETTHHVEHSDHALHSFAKAAKLAGHEAGHFAHILTMAPLPIAAAAIAIMFLNERMKEEAEQAEKAAESNRNFEQSIEGVKRAQAGNKLTAAGEQMRELNNMSAENTKNLKEVGGDEIDTFLSGQLKSHPFLKNFANDKDLRRGELIDQQREIKTAKDQLYAVPLEERDKGGVHSEIIAAHLREMKRTMQGVHDEMKKANGPGSADSNLE